MDDIYQISRRLVCRRSGESTREIPVGSRVTMLSQIGVGQILGLDLRCPNLETLTNNNTQGLG